MPLQTGLMKCDEDDGAVVKALIYGRTSTGKLVPLVVDEDGYVLTKAGI